MYLNVKRYGKVLAVFLGMCLVLSGCSKKTDETTNDISSVKLKSNQEIVACKITAIYGNEIEYTVVKEQSTSDSNSNKGRMPSASGVPDMNGKNSQGGENMPQGSGAPDMNGKNSQGGGNMPQGSGAPDINGRNSQSGGNMPQGGGASDTNGGSSQSGGTPDMNGEEMPQGGGAPDTNGENSQSGGAPDINGESSKSGDSSDSLLDKNNSQDSSDSSNKKSDSSKSLDKSSKKIYTHTDETGSTTIPVGTDVITSFGKTTTFSRLSNGDIIKMIMEKDSSGEKVVVGVWIVS